MREFFMWAASVTYYFGAVIAVVAVTIIAVVTA